jgi:hypothetical protein
MATKWRLDNLDRFRESARRRYRENGGRKKQRKHLLKKKYGVTPEAYDSMLAFQNGCCAICDRESDGIGRWDVLAVDHNHVTGVVRGLLCAQCNAALGGFGDSPTILAAALEYLNE